MASSQLELTRATHEEIERLEDAVIQELDLNPKTLKENVLQANRISKYLDRIMSTGNKLAIIYEDKDGSRREELSLMTGSGPNVYSIFYDKLRDLKDYHRRFPRQIPDDPQLGILLDDSENVPMFTGEERHGRCLDMHEHFSRFLNLKIKQYYSEKFNVVDYISYLTRFFYFIDALQYKDREYKQYLQGLFDYLISFLRRTLPLFDLDKYMLEIDEEFDLKCSSGEFSGWEGRKSSEETMETIASASDRLSAVTEIKKEKIEEELGLAQRSTTNTKGENATLLEVKTEVSAKNNLYCVPCKRMFAKESVFTAHLLGKKHKKNEQLMRSPLNFQSFKEFYCLEYRIHTVASKLLGEQIENTKLNIEKRQARSSKELGEDSEEEEEVVKLDEEEEEEPEIKMTIENYPIGWDGKPIPYWLYKLHGLGVEYKCEICGNTSYWGRKAYEKHFQEWRHAYGMRCLGIPNSKQFQDITKINDATELWEKIKKDTITQTWREEAEEEYEDKEGNVFNKKTYEDLKRQGLL